VIIALLALISTRFPGFIAPNKAPKLTAAIRVMMIGKSGAAVLSIATAMPVRARLAATDKSMQRVNSFCFR